MSASVMVAESNPAKIDGSCTPPPVPAPPPRRPRVREVSSRFMSPVVSVSSSTLSGDLHMMSDRSPMHKQSVRSSSVQRRRNQQEAANVLGSGDENENESKSDLGRSLDNLFKRTPGGFRKPQRAAVKLLRENNEARVEQKSLGSDGLLLRSSGGIEVGSRFTGPKRRPDTPNVSCSFDKNRLHRSNSGGPGSATPVAARQLQLGGMPSSAHISPKVAAPDDSDSASTQQISFRESIASDTSSVESNSCPTSPIYLQKCGTPRPPPDQVCSSMPESSISITVSSRYLGDRTGSRGISGSSTKKSASPCCQTLNMSISSGILQGLSNGNNLPPHPPTAKLAMDAKVRKVNSQQESIHSLKLLLNRHMQWRFINAKTEVGVHAHTQEAERMLYSLSIKIMDLRESVVRKRIELGFLRRLKILLSILDAQMSYLDSWNTFEEEFITSLSEIINGLLNASVQLPISANIKVDLKEFKGALSSALKVMGMIESHFSNFLPKAGEMDKLLSELARVNSVERNYMEESEYLLSETQMLQADECSSIAQLLQLQQRRLG